MENLESLKNRVLDDLEAVAGELGHIPFRSEYRESSVRKLSERQVEKAFGGYGEAIAALKYLRGKSEQFKQSVQEVPLADPAAHLALTRPGLGEAIAQGKKISEFIAEKIQECADEQGIPPYNLTWFDFREYIRMAYGQNQAGITPRDITRAGGYNAIRDAYFPPEASTLTMERDQIRKHAQLNRRLGLHAVRFEDMLDHIEHFSERVFSGRVEASPYRVTPKPTKRIITAMLSDLHFGSDIKRAETGALNYGTIQEARRAAFVFSQICDYKIEHRDETELELLLLGDIFQGHLHDPRDGAALAEQICRSIHILIQGVALCSKAYKVVRVRCQPGNHGRDVGRHHGRAVQDKVAGALETIAYYSIMKACKNLPNVSFDIPLTPFGSYDVFGKKILYTHGDSVLKPGNPGKGIKTESLENQINRINAALPDIEEYAAVLVGHVHTSSNTELANGTVVLTNGALVPVDPFAVSIGILESACSQWVFESVPGFAVGDARRIRVDRRTDEMAELDSVIKPWEGFNE